MEWDEAGDDWSAKVGRPWIAGLGCGQEHVDVVNVDINRIHSESDVKLVTVSSFTQSESTRGKREALNWDEAYTVRDPHLDICAQ